jgi:RHS repeat-associated protein
MAPKVFNNVHCVRDCSGILFRGFCSPFGGWGDKNLLKRYSGKPARTPKKLKLTYDFNALTGNLKSRTNSTFNYQEKFTYDNLDRLTKTELLVNGFVSSTQSQTYDPQGRTTSHSDLGTFTYNGYQQTGLKDLKPTAATYYQGRPTQQITYNAFKSPVQIYEAGKDRISFLYNAAQDRSTMFYGGEQTDPLQRRYRRHYSEDGSMEITNDAQINTTSFVFYLGGDAYTAPAIWKEEFHIPSGQSRRNLYYLHRDYQGTILQITNATGQIQENRLFDAWGNVLKITDAANNIVANFIITDRGYTGHEHLLSVGLINMNARLYDPKLHRFLSPDNYVQDPSNTQNFNRYGYVMNNPLTRIDPSGEFFVIDSWLIGLFSGGWDEANKRAGNDLKIWGGLFTTDNNKCFFGRLWEGISRFTWQLPQTLGGFVTSHSYNTFGISGGVESVNYKYGATVVKTRDGGWGGITQGSFIVGDNSIEADANNPLFQHEYGHYIQSQAMGWAYYPRVAIPSVGSTGDHDLHPVEQDANRRAFLYFNKKVDGFQDDKDQTNFDYRDNRGWDFTRNTLNVNGSGRKGQYVNYQDPAQVLTLNNIRVSAKWYDHFSWVFGLSGAVGVGLINVANYNN